MSSDDEQESGSDLTDTHCVGCTNLGAKWNMMGPGTEVEDKGQEKEALIFVENRIHIPLEEPTVVRFKKFVRAKSDMPGCPVSIEVEERFEERQNTADYKARQKVWIAGKFWYRRSRHCFKNMEHILWSR